MQRPLIFDFNAIPPFAGAMLEWRRSEEPHFSLRNACEGTRRCSPALVSSIVKGRRRLTLDRVDDFARILDLTADEKSYLRRWIESDREAGPPDDSDVQPRKKRAPSRPVSNHLLSDWLNVYVKDASRLVGFKPNSATVYRLLGALATPKRIERSLQFLMREGFLRRTLDGQIVEDHPLVTTTDEIPNDKIRAFHKQALAIAQRGIDIFPLSMRRESAVVMPINDEHLEEIKDILKDAYQRILQFAEDHASDNQRLYQVVLNLSPIGAHDHEQT